MAATIEYYFTLVSPWTYLGHQTLLEIAQRHGASLAYKPVKLAEVWAISGSVPLQHRSETRKRYRLIELQRYGELRGITINPTPRYFPVDPSLADRVTIALTEAGKDPSPFMLRVFSGTWVENRDIADVGTLTGWLAADGFDADALFDAAAQDRSEATYSENTAAAIAADAIGVPTYVLNGEPFWGQDRLDLLERALASGRRPYRP